MTVNDIVKKVRKILNDKNGDRYSDEDLIEAVSDAQRELNRELNILKDTAFYYFDKTEINQFGYASFSLLNDVQKVMAVYLSEEIAENPEDFKTQELKKFHTKNIDGLVNWVGEYATGFNSLKEILVFTQTYNKPRIIPSWSYVGDEITLNVNIHEYRVGEAITITGLEATTNPPNGTYTVTSITTNTVVFTAGATPTGTPTVNNAIVTGEYESRAGLMTSPPLRPDEYGDWNTSGKLIINVEHVKNINNLTALTDTLQVGDERYKNLLTYRATYEALTYEVDPQDYQKSQIYLGRYKDELKDVEETKRDNFNQNDYLGKFRGQR